MKTSLTYKIYSILRSRGFDTNSAQNEDVINMQKEIDLLDSKNINFNLRSYPDGSWIAKSTNVEGIVTGGTSHNEDVDAIIKDAVFTYYGISPKHCEDKLLRGSGQPVNAARNVHVAA